MGAKLIQELQFKTRNDVGILSEITQALRDGGINLTHAWACGEGGTGFFGIVTNHNDRAKKALKKLGIKATEREVLSVSLPNRAGELAKVAKKLAKARVNITCVSATSSSSDRVNVLISTKNNKKAKKIL